MAEPAPELNRLRELGQDDPSLIAVLVPMFTEQAPALLAEIQTQATAAAALGTKQAAHTFKGVCLNLGFERLAELCKQTEDAALAEDFASTGTYLAEMEQSLAALYPQLATLQTEFSEK